MKKGSNATFLVAFTGMFVAGAALILSLPPLFRPHEPHQVWIAGALASLFVAFALGTLWLRSKGSRLAERNTDE